LGVLAYLKLLNFVELLVNYAKTAEHIDWLLKGEGVALAQITAYTVLEWILMY